MSPTKGFLAGVILAGITTLAAPANAATFVQNYCNHNNPSALSNGWTRTNARTYAYVADKEGYQWQGGCHNDNQRDDSPNQAKENSSTDGEGTDCSGLVFKSWALKLTNVGGFAYWNKLTDQHGPNASTNYKNSTWYGGATAVEYHNISKSGSATNFMDAFARTGHIGLIYTDDATSDGQDHIIESYNEDNGTDINVRKYRVDPDYKAVARYGWYPEKTCSTCG